MQKNQWNQYPNAYSKDNSRYTYKMDDGSAVTLTAGKDGVTEDWIARLKAAHVEEMNLLRRGRSKGEGQNRLLSLTQFEDEADDKSSVLIDPNSDVEANFIAELESAEKLDRLQKALESLTPEQRDLLIRVRVKGMHITTIAREQGVDESAVRRRITRIENKIKKNF
jgi:RNA polymerase sigma factor (sigma-70 family)